MRKCQIYRQWGSWCVLEVVVHYIVKIGFYKLDPNAFSMLVLRSNIFYFIFRDINFVKGNCMQ